MTPESDQPAAKIFGAIDRELAFARVLSEQVYVTWWLFASNVLIFVSAMLYGMSDRFEQLKAGLEPVQIVLFTGMKVNEWIAAGEWWRIISSMWVHLDLLHIGFNAYGLYVIGPILEKIYGGRRFFFLYLATGIVGGMASYTFSEMPSGGASGAIYGLVGAVLVIGYKYRRELPPRVSRAFTGGMLPWVVFGIGIGFFDAIPMDNAAHIGGLLSGVLLALALDSRLRDEGHSRATEYGLWGATALGVFLLVVTTWFWSEEVTRCAVDDTSFFECYPEIARDLGQRTQSSPPITGDTP